MDCSQTSSYVCGIFQARILEWVAISLLRGSSQLRNRAWVSCIAEILYQLSDEGHTKYIYIWKFLQKISGSKSTWVAGTFSSNSVIFLHEENRKHRPPDILLLCSVQLLSHVQYFATPWTAAHQASLSITNSQSPQKPMSIESVMLSNHLILCRPLLLLPSIFPSMRVFSNESALHIRWPKYWSFSFNISPSNEHPGLISFRMDWLDPLAAQGTLKSLLQYHSSKV